MPPPLDPRHWRSCGNKGSEWVRGTEEKGSVGGVGVLPHQLMGEEEQRPFWTIFWRISDPARQDQGQEVPMPGALKNETTNPPFSIHRDPEST